MKMFDIGTIEKVTRVIQFWFLIFLSDQLLQFGRG